MMPETIITALVYSLFASVWQAAFIWILAQVLQRMFLLSAKNTYWILFTLIWLLFVAWIGNCIYFINHPIPPLLHLLSVPREAANFIIPNSIFTIIAILYCLGCLYHGFRFTQSLYQLHLLAKHQLPLPASVLSVIHDMQITHPSLKKVVVAATAHASSPLTFGWLQPILLFPVAALNNLSITEVRSILLHELAHIRRNDFLHECLMRIIEIVLFYNPFVRLLINQLKEERENACDDAVIQSGIPVYSYAKALITFAHTGTPHTSITAMALAGNQPRLLNRIKRLATPEREKKVIPLFKSCYALLVLLAGLIWVSNSSKPGNINRPSTVPFAFADAGSNSKSNLPHQKHAKTIVLSVSSNEISTVIKSNTSGAVPFRKKITAPETVSSTELLQIAADNKQVMPMISVAQQPYIGLAKLEQLQRSMIALPDSIRIAFTANAIAQLSPDDRKIWMEALEKLYNVNPENSAFLHTINLQAPFIVFLNTPVSSPLSGIALQCLTSIREQTEAFYLGNHIMMYNSNAQDSTRMPVRAAAIQ